MIKRPESDLMWVSEKAAQKEAALKSLKKCKDAENKLLEKNYKYVKISNTLEILVHCDKKGNPTKKGLEKIEMTKKLLHI